MDNYTPTLDTIFHALADTTRRAVIQQLGKGPASVGDLAQPFDMALPSFMKHIKVLEDSGLIRSEKIGRVRTCEIRKKNLAQAEKWISEQRMLWKGRVDRLEEYVLNLQEIEKNHDN